MIFESNKRGAGTLLLKECESIGSETMPTSLCTKDEVYWRLMKWLADNQGEKPPTKAEVGVKPRKKYKKAESDDEEVATIELATMGVDGAVNSEVLTGKVFVVNGTFEEVNADDKTSKEAIKRTIESFGGKVNQMLNKKTGMYCISVFQ